MTKSYIFNCDDFIPDACGGTFIRGRRKYALTISSSRLPEKILRHVRENVVFSESEYPPVVISTLLREGLLRLHGNGSIFLRLLTWGGFIRRQLRYFVRCILLELEKGPIGFFLVYRLRALIPSFSGQRPVVILSKPMMDAVVRPWAWSVHPVTVGVLGVLDLAWICANLKLDALKNIGAAVHLAPNPALVIVLLLAFVMAHELAHAAAAYNRVGSGGELRMRWLLYIIPCLAVRLPNIASLSSYERSAISLSGPVFQISCAIVLLASAPHSPGIACASELSIVLAGLSLLPFENTDAYWVLVDLLRGRKPRVRLNWARAARIDMIYTLALALLSGTLAVVVYR